MSRRVSYWKVVHSGKQLIQSVETCQRESSLREDLEEKLENGTELSISSLPLADRDIESELTYSYRHAARMFHFPLELLYNSPKKLQQTKRKNLRSLLSSAKETICSYFFSANKFSAPCKEDVSSEKQDELQKRRIAKNLVARIAKEVALHCRYLGVNDSSQTVYYTRFVPAQGQEEKTHQIMTASGYKRIAADEDVYLERMKARNVTCEDVLKGELTFEELIAFFAERDVKEAYLQRRREQRAHSDDKEEEKRLPFVQLTALFAERTEEYSDQHARQ